MKIEKNDLSVLVSWSEMGETRSIRIYQSDLSEFIETLWEASKSVANQSDKEGPAILYKSFSNFCVWVAADLVMVTAFYVPFNIVRATTARPELSMLCGKAEWATNFALRLMRGE